MCSTYMHVHKPYMVSMYFLYTAYIPIMSTLYVSGKYLAMTFEMCIAVNCVLDHVCKKDGSVCSPSIMPVWPISGCAGHICFMMYFKYA